jgi:hypothetical protein
LNTVLRSKLLEMKALDGRTRARLAEAGELFAGYAPPMEEVHSRNADLLAEIVEEHGWPGKRLVGEDGCEAAWLVAQHAISRPAHQRSFLAALTTAVQRKDAPPRHLAYLEDRIRFNERRPQVYGAILDWGPDGELTAGPVEDPETLDARRAAVGLPPLADALAAATSEARQAGEGPPADVAGRDREIDLWAKRVGWL